MTSQPTVKRVFLIVLDSFGVGEAPDAELFGDKGAHTALSVSRSAAFQKDTAFTRELSRIEGLEFLRPAIPRFAPRAAVARMTERSRGKDTTIGHWEIAGLISERPLPTYPEGFPDEVLQAFTAATGYGVLCNRPYSGTAVIEDYGPEHLRTGKLIVYTSADSVFQIAAHEDIVPVETLYDICRKARAVLTGKHGVGRVIARPFRGTPGHFYRTENRHDFSFPAPGTTLPDAIQNAGLDSIAVGKIADIFAHRGFTEEIASHNNTEGMRIALDCLGRPFNGLCFVNLVDFDMLYGHRRDPDGYARAINEFGIWLPSFLDGMAPEDVLFITADHGCDPSFMKTTDHTREYVPLLAFGQHIRPADLGTRSTFADLAATVAEMLSVSLDTPGQSFAEGILQ